jgi:gliding motility-associated-like protein
MRVYLIISALLLLISELYSQHVITYHTTFNNQTNYWVHNFWKVDLATCEQEDFFKFEIAGNRRPFGLTDIGYGPDGFIYGIGASDSTLYRIDIDQARIVGSWPMPPHIQYGGMYINGDGLIILSGEDGWMVTFDIQTEEFNVLGQLDPGFPYRLTLFAIAGYRGRLFGSLLPGHLVEIFLDEMRVEYIMQSGVFEQSLYINEVECGTPTFITGSRGGTLRLIDPSRDTFYTLCDFGFSGNFFSGITSLTEYKDYPNCKDTIDLNGLLPGFDHSMRDQCGTGRAYIAGDSVKVFGSYPIDSIKVSIVSEPAGSVGRLLAPDPPSGALLGSDTDELLASGDIAFAQWETWLKQVEYIDSADPPVSGLRRIAVAGYYHGEEVTDTAWAEIEVLVPDYSAGEGGRVESCPSGERVNLYQYLIGADEEGYWLSGTQDGEIALLPESSGIYHYVVQHPECGSDTAELELYVWSEPDIRIAGGGVYCAGNVVSLSLEGDIDGTITWQWSDGSTGGRIEVSEAGTYWVDMVYGVNCALSDTVLIQFEDRLTLTEERSLCPNQVFMWYNQEISASGEYEFVLSGLGGGCDTVIILSVIDADRIHRSIEWDICPGESVEIYGVVYSEEGRYEALLQGMEGCDTLVSIQINWRSAIESHANISLCPGEQEEIGGEILSAPGTYEILIRSLSSCDTLLYVQVELASLPAMEIIGKDRVCEGESIILKANPTDVLQSIIWNTGETGAEIRITQGGLYSFEAITSASCRVSAEKWIGDCPSRRIYIPNAFSPNGDGINDEWQVYSIADIAELEVQIFDRWGSKVFTHKGESISWDGTFRNQKLAEGVYIFHLHVRFEEGETREEMGEIYLFR